MPPERPEEWHKDHNIPQLLLFCILWLSGRAPAFCAEGSGFKPQHLQVGWGDPSEVLDSWSIVENTELDHRSMVQLPTRQLPMFPRLWTWRFSNSFALLAHLFGNQSSSQELKRPCFLRPSPDLASWVGRRCHYFWMRQPSLHLSIHFILFLKTAIWGQKLPWYVAFPRLLPKQLLQQPFNDYLNATSHLKRDVLDFSDPFAISLSLQQAVCVWVFVHTCNSVLQNTSCIWWSEL